MNKFNVAVFFAALLVIGACAEPRKLLATSEGAKLAEAEEHQRILAELEEVHQLRERMLQEGKTSSLVLHYAFTAEPCAVMKRHGQKHSANLEWLHFVNN